jgi:hypothetical protein
MKLKLFCCCSLFPSWFGKGLISTPVYINSTNIPPIMIINRIYETQNRRTRQQSRIKTPYSPSKYKTLICVIPVVRVTKGEYSQKHNLFF